MIRSGDERRRLVRGAVTVCACFIVAASSGCGVGAGGWRGNDLATQTIDWRGVDGQRLLDVLATPSIAARHVDLLLCRWSVDRPIRVAWPENATEKERVFFEQAAAAWSGLVEGLVLEAVVDGSPEIRVRFAEEGDPAAPSGTADTVADCIVDAGASAIAHEADRGRIVAASIVMRRENVDWAGGTSPMSDEEFLGTALHELGHALGLAGHIGSRGSVMSVERTAVRRATRKVLAGDGLRSPTLVALYTVPIGASVGGVGFDAKLRPSLELLVDLAAREGWRGPFGRAGGDAAHVFWQTPSGAHPGVFTFQWSNGIRGKREIDWRLSLSARSALGGVPERGAAP